VVDADKDWNGKKISNLGLPSVAKDALRYGDEDLLDTSKFAIGTIPEARIPRIGLSKLPLGTLNYLLKGQGASDSVYALLTSEDIPSLDVSKITTGRFGMARMPDGTSGYVLTAKGAGVDPAYEAVPYYHDSGAQSDAVVIANDAERTASYQSSYYKLKEVQIKVISGTLMTYFELRTPNASYPAYGRVYKNGVALGTERSTTSTSFVGFSEALSFSANDLYQVYAYQGATNIPVRKQRICGGLYGVITAGY
jgi:hypothetical protein